jgi:pimeloyl-ACP methyl ester carboxylesterase
MRQGTFFRGRFGIYACPSAGIERHQVIVMCAPAKQECARSQWVWHVLMNRFAECGFHAFSFDYWGSGNSQGHSLEATYSNAVIDVRLAVAEALDMSGATDVILVGLRLGANAALRFAKDAPGVRGLCLWDPIACGRTYLSELMNIHERVVGKTSREPSRVNIAARSHLLGYPLSNYEAAELESIKLDLSRLRGEGIQILRHSDFPDDYLYWSEHHNLEEPIKPKIAMKRILSLVESL